MKAVQSFCVGQRVLRLSAKEYFVRSLKCDINQCIIRRLTHVFKHARDSRIKLYTPRFYTSSFAITLTRLLIRICRVRSFLTSTQLSLTNIGINLADRDTRVKLRGGSAIIIQIYISLLLQAKVIRDETRNVFLAAREQEARIFEVEVTFKRKKKIIYLRRTRGIEEIRVEDKCLKYPNFSVTFSFDDVSECSSSRRVSLFLVNRRKSGLASPPRAYTLLIY